MNAMEWMLKNRKLEMENAVAFKKHFRVNIHNFMDYTTGFDVVKFDEFLKTPDGTSTHDWIEEKHGKEAVGLVNTLLGIL